MEREYLVKKLFLGVALSPDERRALGGFVTRDELAVEIARELERDGRFPFDDDNRRGMQIVNARASFTLPGGAPLPRLRVPSHA
jgi:hypothetical protein